MLTGLDDVDWASMRHAYGSAEDVPDLILGLRSPDAAERDKALSGFYSTVHHQGDIYRCTTASLPFLFTLATDNVTPARGDVVGLVTAIGREAVERCESEWWSDVDAFDPEHADMVDHVAAARVVREHGDLFFRFATAPDPGVRRSGIAGLGYFVDDAARAAAALRERLGAERGTVLRLLVVETMATLALRRPECTADAQTWLAGLAADPAVDPETRIAALVHQARCAPERIDDDLVPAVVALLKTVDDAGWRLPPPPQPAQDTVAPQVAPQVADMFEYLDRINRIHAPTTTLLRTFHEVLDGRVPHRTALLAEQLHSRDPGVVIDAIRMSITLMQAWRGDHAHLVTEIAAHLGSPHHEVAAEAAAALHACHVIAEPAREALAAHVTAQGPTGWEATEPATRRAHQEAVAALARLGDVRAVPSLSRAFDREVDDWRATDPAAALVGVAPELIPHLCGQLRRLDLSRDRATVEMTARSVLAALARAAPDTRAFDAIVGVLRAAVDRQRWDLTTTALKALTTFGPAAATALPEIRPLTASADLNVRSAAAGALWAVGRDVDAAVPLLIGLLGEDSPLMSTFDVLGAIGPPAAAALPRLREHLRHSYEWVRVHCAAAIWDIAGPPEAPTVLAVLLQAWTQNPATATVAAACLDRMGPAAEPAVPHLREQLARPHRAGKFADIRGDEDLQRTSRVVLARFG
ncbi:hypothetical protein [Virgisporangium aurantiacum]|nr:hypothetical protein [Virgisporangium aurantiacum]